MLTYLRIRNFALIQEMEISFGPGLTVFTGETGAGKSMILQAVALLRGERASADLIQSQAEEAQIEAIFSPSNESVGAKELMHKLELAGIEIPDFEQEGLIVKRVLSQKGKHRIYIANQLVSLSLLGEICGGLIDVSSQHEHQTLMDSSKHLALLDRSGVDEELRANMATVFEELQKTSLQLKQMITDQKNRAEQEDFIRFQLQELISADLKEGEDEQLRKERERLKASDRLNRAFERADQFLSSQEGAALFQVERVRKDLAELISLESRLKPLVDELQEAYVLLEDAAREIRRYQDTFNAHPERLQEVEDRLHLLSKILKKHGPDINSAIQKQTKLTADLKALEHKEEKEQELEEKINHLRKQAFHLATQLSQKRRQVANLLGQQASASLKTLAMPHAQLSPHITERAAKEGDDPHFIFTSESGVTKRLSKEGWDRCEILFAPNLGEEAKPLQKIASGGELSRILLALKKTLAQGDHVATYVFDEVDSGIGGKTADQVGKQLALLSQKKQVFCITHLAQIAAYAQAHLIVEKNTAQGKTRTTVKPLQETQREEEIARMLGGAKITEKTREHAKELIVEAGRYIE